MKLCRNLASFQCQLGNAEAPILLDQLCIRLSPSPGLVFPLFWFKKVLDRLCLVLSYFIVTNLVFHTVYFNHAHNFYSSYIQFLTIKLILLLLYNCTFAAVMNSNVSILGDRGLPRELWPQVENHCPTGLLQTSCELASHKWLHPASLHAFDLAFWYQTGAPVESYPTKTQLVRQEIHGISSFNFLPTSKTWSQPTLKCHQLSNIRLPRSCSFSCSS